MYLLISVFTTRVSNNQAHDFIIVNNSTIVELIFYNDASLVILFELICKQSRNQGRFASLSMTYYTDLEGVVSLSSLLTI